MSDPIRGSGATLEGSPYKSWRLATHQNQHRPSPSKKRATIALQEANHYHHHHHRPRPTLFTLTKTDQQCFSPAVAAHRCNASPAPLHAHHTPGPHSLGASPKEAERRARFDPTTFPWTTKCIPQGRPALHSPQARDTTIWSGSGRANPD